MHNETDKLLKFIQSDTESAGKVSQLFFWLSVTIGCTAAAIFSLVGINPSLVVFKIDWPLLMLFLLVVVFISFLKVVQSRRFSQIFLVSSALAVAASFALPQWTTGFVEMGQDAAFVEGTIKCFLLGFLSSSVAAGGLITLFFKRGPVPTGAVRFSIAVLSSLMGVAVLFFHCPSSNLAHIFTGHVTQVAAVIAVSFALVEFLFVKLVRKQLSSAAIQFDNLSRFDR